MPKKQHLIHEYKLAVDVAFGEFSYEDAIADREEFAALVASWGSDLSHMMLCTEDIKIVIGQSDLVRFIASEPSEDKAYKSVFVANSDVVYGVARQYMAHRQSDGDTISVFRSVGEALTYLGLPQEIESSHIAAILSDPELSA